MEGFGIETIFYWLKLNPKGTWNLTEGGFSVRVRVANDRLALRSSQVGTFSYLLGNTGPSGGGPGLTYS